MIGKSAGGSGPRGVLSLTLHPKHVDKMYFKVRGGRGRGRGVDGWMKGRGQARGKRRVDEREEGG